MKDRQLTSVTGRLTWRTRELSAATGLSEPTIRRALRMGELKAQRVGRAVLIEDAEARRFLAGEKVNT